LAARRGKKKAIVAVGHSILVIAYQLLARGVTYAELGGTYFDEREPRATERRLVRRLEGLGYRVLLEPAVRTTAAGERRPATGNKKRLLIRGAESIALGWRGGGDRSACEPPRRPRFSEQTGSYREQALCSR
jgi:hypothetical protein